MPVYVCRWPNGDFSLISANNKEDACWGLDEWGPADPENVKVLKRFAVDFKLKDNGEFEHSFGGYCVDAIEALYPLIQKAKSVEYDAERELFSAKMAGEKESVMNKKWEEHDEATANNMAKAVMQERDRVVWDAGRNVATPAAQHRQELMAMSATVAEASDCADKVI